jgi:ribosomal protein S18 acetylase RimI-like enzyme
VRERCRGRGLGSALVAATQQALARRGMRNASLSVTVENDAACRLYRRLGFRVRKEFGAHAWVRPPERIQLPA